MWLCHFHVAVPFLCGCAIFTWLCHFHVAVPFSLGCAIFMWLCHFHVAVPQPVSFCMLNRLANCSVHFFPTLNTSFPGEALPGETKLPLFNSFAAIRPKWVAVQTSPQRSVERFRNSYNRRDKHLDKYMKHVLCSWGTPSMVECILHWLLCRGWGHVRCCGCAFCLRIRTCALRLKVQSFLLKLRCHYAEV